VKCLRPISELGFTRAKIRITLWSSVFMAAFSPVGCYQHGGLYGVITHKTRTKYEGESVNRSQMGVNSCNGRNRFSVSIIM
jgi:hypothetical protein